MGIPFIIVTCPTCDKVLEFDTPSRTGLGPMIRKCNKCGETFVSGQKEWQEMTLPRRAVYVVCSLAYVGFLSVAGGASAQCAFALFTHPEETKPLAWGPISVPAAVLWGLAIVAIQIWRVLSSMRRSGEKNPPYRWSVFDLQVALTAKVMSLLILPVFLAWGLGGLLSLFR